ncbi:unnamed protein product, partial [Amoebophrya sp. A120]|eukprot:GSA120T00021884001.1
MASPPASSSSKNTKFLPSLPWPDDFGCEKSILQRYPALFLCMRSLLPMWFPDFHGEAEHAIVRIKEDFLGAGSSSSDAVTIERPSRDISALATSSPGRSSSIGVDDEHENYVAYVNDSYAVQQRIAENTRLAFNHKVLSTGAPHDV